MSIPRQAASVHSILAGQPWTCSPLSRNCKAFLQAHSRVRARAIWIASDAKKGMERRPVHAWRPSFWHYLLLRQLSATSDIPQTATRSCCCCCCFTRCISIAAVILLIVGAGGGAGAVGQGVGGPRPRLRLRVCDGCVGVWVVVVAAGVLSFRWSICRCSCLC